MKHVLFIALGAVCAPSICFPFQDSKSADQAAKILPNGPGKQAVVTACTSCHNIGNVVRQKKTAREWTDVMADMQTRGMEIEPQQSTAAVHYLAAHFGKNSKFVVPDELSEPAPAVAAKLDPSAPIRVSATDRSTDWTTWGHDVRRSGWATAETAISPKTVSRLALKWKTQIDSEVADAVESSLTAPIVVSSGKRTLLFTLAASNTLAALDAASGQIVWQKKFSTNVDPAAPANWMCTNTPNTTPVVDKARGVIYVISVDGMLHALRVDNGEDQFAPVHFVPPYSRNWSLNLFDGVLYTSVGRGCGGTRAQPIASHLIAMDLNDPSHPVSKFFTSSGRPAGLWGRGGPVIGPGGIYFQTADGTFDPGTNKYGNSVINLSPKTLELRDYFSPANMALLNQKDLDFGAGGPLTFPFADRELVAAAGKDGTVYLLDAKSLGGPDHQTPLFAARYGNDAQSYAGNGVWGAMATAVDAKGTRWLYVPMWGPASKEVTFEHSYGDTTLGCMMGFRVAGQNGKPALIPTWVSRDLGVPDPPVFANGVVFGLSTGENTQQRTFSPLPEGDKSLGFVGSRGQDPNQPRQRIMTNRERLHNVANAVLYGFDAATGKELYSSGEQIDDWTHFSGLSVVNGTVYVVTRSSRVYAFALPGK